ncbi:MAG TPA: flagellar export protein FliJ [Candidatus Acidoferrales bacterium]|jgi:flagellar export protein FliJ|nr:flagellar export protein FliJ [Candidatus Acidoferrales bacterium]
MARFAFRLEPLLDARKRTEDEKRRDLAACRNSLERCAGERRRFAVAREACIAALFNAVRTRPVRDLRALDRHLRYLCAAETTTRAQETGLAESFERARDELIFANRERRVVEKIKARRRRVFEAQEARREELELDDGNARRHERTLRKRGAG